MIKIDIIISEPHGVSLNGREHKDYPLTLWEEEILDKLMQVCREAVPSNSKLEIVHDMKYKSPRVN